MRVRDLDHGCWVLHFTVRKRGEIRRGVRRSSGMGKRARSGGRRNEEGAESAKAFASIYTAQLYKRPTVWFIFASTAPESPGSRRRQTAGLSRKIIESGFQVHLAAAATYSANPNRICWGAPGTESLSDDATRCSFICRLWRRAPTVPTLMPGGRRKPAVLLIRRSESGGWDREVCVCAHCATADFVQRKWCTDSRRSHQEVKEKKPQEEKQWCVLLWCRYWHIYATIVMTSWFKDGQTITLRTKWNVSEEPLDLSSEFAEEPKTCYIILLM